MSKIFGNPRISIYRGSEKPRYAGRTLVRSAYSYVMHDRVLDCLGFGWDGSDGAAGRMGRRVGWDSGSDGAGQ